MALPAPAQAERTWEAPQRARSGDGVDMVDPRAAYTARGELVAAWSRADTDNDPASGVGETPLRVAVRALGAQGVPGMEEPYERLKELTRGRRIDGDDLREFVRGLGLPADVEARFVALTPQTYTALASRLVDDYLV